MYEPMSLARTRWALLLGATLASFPAAGSAQAGGQTTVGRQLATVIAEAGRRGLSLAHPVIEGNLADRQRDTVRVTLQGARTYAIYGACDQDCTDLHMQVIDGAGVAIDSLGDTEEPILQIDTPRTEQYRIVVSTDCRMDPCRFGLAILVIPPRPPRNR